MNAYFVVKRDSLIINALPFILGIFLMVIFSFDKLIYFIVFFTPLSLPLSHLVPGFGFDMFLPTEPLLFGILIIFFLKIIYERGIDRDILTHPVSLAIYLNLLWIFFTSLTSTMPIVSFKLLLSRVWFIVALYLIAAKMFKEGKNMERYIWLYLISFSVVIFYAIYRHVGYGIWNKQAAHFVVTPFYNDHTSYGAAIAIFLPFAAVFAFNSFFNRKVKLISLLFFGILIIALVLSYSRAAWLSIAVALVVVLVIKLRIRFQPIFLTILSAIILIVLFQTQILMYLERNSEESSSNLGEHLSSMSNITSDASNLERLNRWSCAIRMFEDKPVFGFGPGTYMFNYAPYQLSKDRTIISTNAADAGNAHSEYLGPLSESGVLGTLTFLLIIVIVIYTAIHTYTRTNDPKLKSFVLAALTGLVTYYIHGFLNNFLDTDKLSVPFWGFTAMIVAIDIYSRKEEKIQKNQGLL